MVYPRKHVLFRIVSLVRRMYRKGLRYYPFRMSTLVDPFPPHEELYRFSEKVLRILSEYEYPVIINTKSTLIAREPWMKYIMKLAESNRILIQISTSLLVNGVDSVLEPVAPPTLQRLSLARKLSEVGVKTVIRVSPFIPSISASTVEEIERTVDVIAEQGVEHVIFEGLRVKLEELSQMIEMLSSYVSVESYGAGAANRIVRISRSVLEPLYRIYANLLSKHGVKFSTCKEGFFNLHTAEDCCGFYTLKDCVRRPTLWDVYTYVVQHGAAEPHVVISHICRESGILCSDGLDGYPRELLRPLKRHERRLVRVLSNGNAMERLVPLLTISNGKILVKFR